MTNISRFENDIEKMVSDGGWLHTTMMFETRSRAQFEKEVLESIPTADIEKTIKNLRDFASDYEAWYSQGLYLVKQMLPERLDNFRTCYEREKGRHEITVVNYVLLDYLEGITMTKGGEEVVGRKNAINKFSQQLNIIKATRHRFKSSLFDMKQILQADLYDNELLAARTLAKQKFLRAAGAMAGVIIERHLLSVCDTHGVKSTRKNPNISDLNDALKNNDVYDVVPWRHIQLCADIRNQCDHSKSIEPTEERVQTLLDGADQILKTVF